MRRNLIRESTEAATRLVVVKAARRVFVVRRFGVDSILRAQGIFTSMGATAVQMARAQLEREKTDAQIAENVEAVRTSTGDAAAELERKQLEELVASQAKQLTTEQQIALYTDEVFPLVAAAVSHIGELREDVDVDGLQPQSTRVQDVCTDLGGGVFVEPVKLVFSDDADPEKGELAIWTFGAEIIAFGTNVMTAATDFQSVTLPSPETRVADAGGQVGAPVRTTPLRDAFGQRSAPRGA